MNIQMYIHQDVYCNKNEITYFDSFIEATNKYEQTKFRLDEISKIDFILSKRLIKENHAVKN